MVSDSDADKGVMEGHTRAKHQILEKYLAAWFPILSAYRGRVLYIDGFGGRGRYGDGSERSPQLAMRTLLKHPILAKREDCDFIFIFIEKNAKNAKALEAELDALEKTEDAPPNVKWTVVNASFDDCVEDLLAEVDHPKLQPPP